MAAEIIMALVGVFCTALSSVITFFLTKKKYGAEVESQQIENMKQSFEVYKTMMEESLAAQGKRIETLQRENEYLRTQFNQLQNQMVSLLVGKKLGMGEFDKEQS
jgi:FtsZ-binding cell division protein ZapB